MRTLFPPSFNVAGFLLAAIIIRALFLTIDWLSFAVILISLYQFMLLFSSINSILPVRYLLGAFMCIQFFIGPMLAYNGLDQYQYSVYKMKIPAPEYFAYAIPAVVCFILGVHTRAGRFKGEIIDVDRIAKFTDRHKRISFIFIGVGLVTSLISGLVASELGFVFYLLGSLKFIGMFMLILGNTKLKILPLVLVMGSIVSTSLGNGMFHDLITWMIFTIAVIAVKYKFTQRTKLIGLGVFMIMIVTIQLLKGSYREAAGQSKEGGDAETLVRVYEQQNKDNGLFNAEKIAGSNVRINQGFIITNIMFTVPQKVPYSNGGELVQVLEAAILPRVLAPNKLKAGDKEVFTKYSGIYLREGTSMGLSSLGDGYLNFGLVGGAIFMYFLGLLYSVVLNAFDKQSLRYPIMVLFTALVFYYPIRPDCELQTILGHLVKSCVVIGALIYFNKHLFYLPKLRPKLA